MFADDTNLFVSAKNIKDSITATETTLNKLFQWFTDNKLTLNVDKTCFSIFSTKTFHNNVLQLGDKQIIRVKSVKYIGLYLDEKLNWHDHVNYINQKLVRLNGAFSYISQFIHRNQIMQLYYAYVFPYIKYGIEIYGSCAKYTLNKIQATQTRLLKLLFQNDRRETF